MPRRLRRTTALARASLVADLAIKKAAQRCHATGGELGCVAAREKDPTAGIIYAIAERIRSPSGALWHLPGKSRNGPGRRQW